MDRGSRTGDICAHDTCWVRVSSVELDLEQLEDFLQFQWSGTCILAKSQKWGPNHCEPNLISKVQRQGEGLSLHSSLLNVSVHTAPASPSEIRER